MTVTSEPPGQVNQDRQVAAGLPGRIEEFFDQLIATFSLSIDAFLFHPQGRRQEHVGQLRCLAVLNDLGNDQETFSHRGAVALG